jgi:hypothetical protein
MPKCFARTGIKWGDYQNCITGMIAEKNPSQSNNQKNHNLDRIGCVVRSWVDFFYKSFLNSSIVNPEPLIIVPIV